MSIFEKIQTLNPLYKKFIIFGIIILLAILFSFFIIKNFQKNLNQFEKEKFLKELNIQEIKEKKNELENQLKKLDEMIEQVSTTTTTTNSK